MTPKEMKKEYGNRILKAESESSLYIQRNFSFREKIEISHYFDDLSKKFESKLEEAMLRDIIEGSAPVYMEKRGSNKLVRCVRIQSKVKDYVKVTPEDLKEIEGDIYVRQDDANDDVYGRISEDVRKKVLK